MTRSSRGVSLTGLVVTLFLFGLAVVLIGKYLSFGARASRDSAIHVESQKLLDLLRLEIETNFQRRAKVNGYQIVPSTGGPTGCSDLILRQTVLGTAGAPDTYRKIAFENHCEGPAASVPVPPNLSVFGVAASNCTQPPGVHITTWMDEAHASENQVVKYPTADQRASSICFRTVGAPPSRLEAEIALIYGSDAAHPETWVAKRRVLSLDLNDLGESIEIVAPH